jgi:hypothetical protein
MTTKLPEVGNIYNSKTVKGYTCRVTRIEIEDETKIYIKPPFGSVSAWVDEKCFWENYEELPTSAENAQVGAVDKALEELKRFMKTFYGDCKEGDPGFGLFAHARDLVNALEAEKMTGFKHQAWGLRKDGTFGNMDEPKIDAKKERVDSVKESIWKSVSEFPEIDNERIIWRNLEGKCDIFEIACWPGKGALLRSNHGSVCFKVTVGEFCLLSDFINKQEELEERVRKLEGKK